VLEQCALSSCFGNYMNLGHIIDVASLMHAHFTGDENQPVPLLHSCAVEGLTGAGAKLLCAAGVNLEARCANDGDVRTALMWATGGPERIENLKALLDAGACMTSSSADSYTAFGIAAEKNNVIGVKEFLARGIDVNLRAMPSGHTALMKACEHGNLAIVMTLCKAGADVQARAYGSYIKATPLGQAIGRGHWLVVDYLLRSDKTLDINKPSLIDAPALCDAAEHNFVKVVEVLLTAGANTEVRARDGHTPFFLACMEGHIEPLEVLLKAGCDINCPNDMGCAQLVQVCTYTIVYTMYTCTIMQQQALVQALLRQSVAAYACSCVHR
jgi:Ankyrin repeats (3 copies)/Ankyrin repeat